MLASNSIVRRRRLISVAIVSFLCLLAVALPASAQTVSQITIPLNEYQGSGVSGMASLSAVGNFVDVNLMLDGAPVTGDHPAHIHTGTCENFDPNPIFPLTTVVLGLVDGKGGSHSLVQDASMRDLLADDYVILVHKSAEELTNYFVCGDISGPALAIVGSGGDEAGTVSVAEITVQEQSGTSTASQSRDGTVRLSETKPASADRPVIDAVPSAGSGSTSSSESVHETVAIAIASIALALAVCGVGALLRPSSRDSFTPRHRR